MIPVHLFRSEDRNAPIAIIGAEPPPGSLPVAMNTQSESWPAPTESRLLMAILAGASALRLYHVNAPPIDFQSWRESYTLMVARNFFRHGFNPFFPRVDFRLGAALPETNVLAATELMITPYLTALLYTVLGTGFWVNRVVPIFFSLFGLVYFYRLVRRFDGPHTALAAAVLLAVSPYYLYCGRCQMPEAFVFAMSFVALFHYDAWLERKRWRDFLVAAAAAILMIVGKPHLGVMAVPMAYLTFHRMGPRAFRDWRVYAFAALVAAPCVAYLWWSFFELASRSGVEDSTAVYFSHSRWLLNPDYYKKIGLSAWLWALTPPVVVLGVVGIFRAWSHGRYALAWLAGALSFFFIIPGGAETNGYYQLILAPPMIVLASAAITRGMEKSTNWSYGLRLALVVTVVGGTSVYSVMTAYRMFQPLYADDYRCGEWIRTHTPPEAMVLSASPNPTMLYLADRVGWTSFPKSWGIEPQLNADFLDAVGRNGATVLGIPYRYFDDGAYDDFNDLRDRLYATYRCDKGDGFTVFYLNAPADLSVSADGRIEFGMPDSRRCLRGRWGLDQVDASGRGFAPMGPSVSAGIEFGSETPPKQIVLTVAARSAGTVIAKVNGQPAGIAQAQGPETTFDLVLDNPAGEQKFSRYHVTLEFSERGALRLYELRVVW